MSGRAYIDSSCLVAIAFGEPGSSRLATRIRSFTTIAAHALLEAEVRSACTREDVPVPKAELDTIAWVEPGRTLSPEIDRVLSHGYLRGADCWHLAIALFLSPDPRQLTFLTLDNRQRGVARKMGFKA